MSRVICNIAVVFGICSITVGCNTVFDPNPPTISYEKSDGGKAFDGSLTWWQEQAIALHKDYHARADESAWLAEALNIPIVGLAVAAAGSLLFNANTSTTAALGLAAGGLGAFRAYWSPGTGAASYSDGARRIGCIVDQLPALRRNVTDQEQKQNVSDINASVLACAAVGV